MSGVDTRHIPRDSLFLLAELKLPGGSDGARVKVRNLSTGGMMAEGKVPGVERGQTLSVALRNIGWVEGNVAWVQENRFGIAFANPIDPQDVRAKPSDEEERRPPRFVRTLATIPKAADDTKRKLRKI